MCLGAISFAAIVSYHPNGGRWLAIAYKSSFNYCAGVCNKYKQTLKSNSTMRHR